MEEFERRVSELERRANRYRNALVLLVVGLCGIAVVGATSDDGIIRGKFLLLENEEGELVVGLGADGDGNGNLTVKSKTGTDLIYAGASAKDTGFLIESFNKTGEEVVQLRADEYGNGYVSAFNRKGRGKTLQPGP